MVEIAFCVALFGLSIVSGMLGIGVALLAVPVLSLGLTDLVNQVHPLSLILNGITALFSAVAFARAGVVHWKPALLLALVATIGAPLGAMLARLAPGWSIWTLYAASVLFVCYRMYQAPPHEAASNPINLRAIAVLTFPAAILSGFVGVGPGFLLVPLMVHFQVSMRAAAAINAVAVTPASFAAVLPHAAHMALNWTFVAELGVASAGGAFVGGVLASHRISPATLRTIFVVTLLGTFAARGFRALF